MKADTKDAENKTPAKISNQLHYGPIIVFLAVLLISAFAYNFNQSPNRNALGYANNSNDEALNESFELDLDDCIDNCGDGICQELTCELSVKQLGAGSTWEDKCSPLEEKRTFKEYWDNLRYFDANVTCPETAENCPSDCGSEAKSDFLNAQAVGMDYVLNLSEYRLYGGSNLRDLSVYGDFSRGFYENGTPYYNLGYWFEVRTEKLPWAVAGYTVNLTTSEGRVINVKVANYTNSQ